MIKLQAVVAVVMNCGGRGREEKVWSIKGIYFLIAEQLLACQGQSYSRWFLQDKHLSFYKFYKSVG
jgi:hypothetical protein